MSPPDERLYRTREVLTLGSVGSAPAEKQPADGAQWISTKGFAPETVLRDPQGKCPHP